MEPLPSPGSCSCSYLHPLARQIPVLLHQCLLVSLEELVAPQHEVDPVIDLSVQVLKELLEGGCALLVRCSLVLDAEMFLKCL